MPPVASWIFQPDCKKWSFVSDISVKITPITPSLEVIAGKSWICNNLKKIRNLWQKFHGLSFLRCPHMLGDLKNHPRIRISHDRCQCSNIPKPAHLWQRRAARNKACLSLWCLLFKRTPPRSMHVAHRLSIPADHIFKAKHPVFLMPTAKARQQNRFYRNIPILGIGPYWVSFRYSPENCQCCCQPTRANTLTWTLFFPTLSR